LAAAQGDQGAQLDLGLLYYNGRGVTQNYKKAARWYRLAAEQGKAAAQFNLGLLYDAGQGVPQDYIEAHMWFNLAGASGDAIGIKNRDIIARKMRPEQIAEAQRRAREWKPKTTR
jgi:TPR repeat protein